MVDQVKCVISKNKQRLTEMPFVPRSSFGRASLGKDGENKLFLMYLFINMDLGIQFLKDVGLIRSMVICNTCSRDMTWCTDPKCKDSFRWRCHCKSAAVCSKPKSIKHASWFQHSNITFQEVMFLTYDIVRHEPASLIKQEYRFSPTMIADWGQF